ncbi:MAG: Trk system potassium transporter TrkA [Bacteroidota bacterium]
MRIIIAGAGNVGFHLAKMLSNEAQDIVLVDNNSEALHYAETHLDVITLRGNATSPRVLREANVEAADMLISVTSSETTNITTSIVGKRLGAKQTIARISNPELLHCGNDIDFHSLGIDNLISPEELAALEIERLVGSSAVSERADFGDGKLSLIGLHIPANAPIRKKSVAEAAQMFPELSFMPVAILRNNRTIIPRGSTPFRVNDLAYFIVEPQYVDGVVEMVGKEMLEIRNIMILGGSGIGVNTARRIANEYHVKLIEQHKQKCFDLADSLPRTLIINGDGRNVELLEEEDISEMDAFIAVTGNSETNIMSCLVAKAHGVQKTIALVENIDYINVSQTIGIDTMINKKLIAASNIFRYVRQGDVLNLTNISGIIEAEVLEFVAHEGSRITRKPIRKLGFPEKAIIGGVVRAGKGMTVLGDFQVQPGDRVVIFALPQAMRKVEALFK